MKIDLPNIENSRKMNLNIFFRSQKELEKEKSKANILALHSKEEELKEFHTLEFMMH